MTEEEKKQIEKAAKSIREKIDLLNMTKTGNCYVCNNETNNWISLIPEDFDDIDLGETMPGKRRIAFAPVCYTHDLTDKDIIKQINKVFSIKLQTLKN